MAIDWNFIRELEGFITEANVPTNEDGTVAKEAGVTIGSGIDLGERTEASLRRLGVSESIISKLKDYLRLKGEKASNKIREAPLILTEDEAIELTELVKRDTAKKVKSWYNKNNNVGNEWADLTDRQQTIISSVHFQYGAGNKEATPKFNKSVLNNNWADTISELRNFGDKFDKRRHKELQYLVNTKVDAVIGDNTEEAIRDYIAAAEINTTQRGLVTEQPLPSTPTDPNTFARVPTRTNIEEQTLQSVANPVASDEADDEFIARLYEGLGRVLNAPQRASQTPSRGRIELKPEEEQLTEGEQKLIDSAVNYTEQVEPTKSSDAVELTPGELRLLESATGMSASRIRKELGVGKTEEERDPRASGTVETEKPIVVPNDGEQNDSSKDPIFGIF